MQEIEREFEEATKAGDLAGVFLGAASRNGSLDYFKAFGKVSLEVDASSTSASTTIALASATKIVTSVAAMQCVERGLILLDDDISKHLPEWKTPMILAGFDEQNHKRPVLEKAKNVITLRIRHLLSHTSGVASLEDEKIMEYWNSMGDGRGTLVMRYFMSEDPNVRKKALPEVQETMGNLVTSPLYTTNTIRLIGVKDIFPLIFEPGTEWAYGQGTDWAGKLIERVTNMTLEAYCQKNIFIPMGMKSTTFRLLSHPGVHSNLMSIHSRNKEGKVQPAASIYPLDPKDDMGGSGLYTSAPDFMRFLSSLMRNDGMLLGSETVSAMFGYRLPYSEEFEKFRGDKEAIDSFGDMAPDGMRIDHCLAGQVALQDLKGGRKKGSVNWAGATGVFWWIDVVAGICGFYGSQNMLMGDQQISASFFRKFEKAVYASYGGNVSS